MKEGYIMIQRLERVSNDVPVGYDYKEVLEKGKNIFKAVGCFVMLPYKTLDQRIIWSAESKTISPFEYVKGMRKYKYIKDLDEWIEIEEIGEVIKTLNIK